MELNKNITGWGGQFRRKLEDPRDHPDNDLESVPLRVTDCTRTPTALAFSSQQHIHWCEAARATTPTPQSRPPEQWTVTPHPAGGWEPKVRVLAGLVSRGPSPWLTDSHVLPVSACGLSCVGTHPGVSHFSWGHQSYWVKTHLKGLILTESLLQRPHPPTVTF